MVAPHNSSRRSCSRHITTARDSKHLIGACSRWGGVRDEQSSAPSHNFFDTFIKHSHCHVGIERTLPTFESNMWRSESWTLAEGSKTFNRPDLPAHRRAKPADCASTRHEQGTRAAAARCRQRDSNVWSAVRRAYSSPRFAPCRLTRSAVRHPRPHAHSRP